MQHYINNFGFVTIPVLIAILLGSALVGGGSYYIVKEISESNEVNQKKTETNIVASQATTTEHIDTSDNNFDTSKNQPAATETKSSQKIESPAIPVTPNVIPEIKLTPVAQETSPVPAVEEQAQVDIPPQWLNPDGSFKTPEQIAAEIVEELKKLNSTDDYDPYGVLSDGTAYTPEQLNAIDCAWYGRNCPTVYIIEE